MYIYIYIYTYIHIYVCSAARNGTPPARYAPSQTLTSYTQLLVSSVDGIIQLKQNHLRLGLVSERS